MANKAIAIVWATAPARGKISVQHGRLTTAAAFDLRKSARHEACITAARLGHGAPSTLVTVATDAHTFTFFLRDVTREHPIFLPAAGVAVTVAGDRRDYASLAADVRSMGLSTELQRIAQEPEETFDAAATATQSLKCQTWLGLSRDIRLFAVEAWDFSPLAIYPRQHSQIMRFEGSGDPVPEARLEVRFGRGDAAVREQRRWLDDGSLPILHMRQSDGPVVYDVTCFVTWEHSPLRMDRLRGTHYAVAQTFARTGMFTPEQAAQRDALLPGETDPDNEQPVLVVRVKAINNDRAPRHAWLFAPRLLMKHHRFDPRHGTQRFDATGKVFAATLLDGKPIPQPEAAMLLAPGASATCDILMPHQPLPPARGQRLKTIDVPARLEECRTFWRKKLDAAASINVPETRIDQMVRAGLLHLDMITYGREPRDATAACVGVYSPIGSESAPIIQFMDAMGWHDLAARSLQFFLERQHDNGFIQTFGGYMLETGPTLWSIGEHWRYTRDRRWAERVIPHVRKACNFLLAWRHRNLKRALRGKGYGLIEGKVADPEDHYRQYMLNATACLGVSRSAELLRDFDPSAARQLAREAAAWKRHIRDAVAQTTAESPVIPLGDGTWAPTTPPWAEMRGFTSQYVDGKPNWTHGAVCSRDSLIGPLYLILGEIIDAREPLGDHLVQTHQVLATVRNAALSQPYYARHDLAHLRRGEIKAYLKTFYNQLASLADRETYTFWEHLHKVSPHKTHEEGWFLMQVRWMLWLEEADGVHLLPAVPSNWLADGKQIKLDRVASYFGPLSLQVESDVSHNRITAHVTFDPRRGPKWATLRLPHPQGATATQCTGGTYNPATQTVALRSPGRTARVELRF